MAKRIKKRAQPRMRRISAQRVTDGWPHQGGVIRRIRAGEWARANELLPAAGVELDEYAIAGIDDGTLGAALLDGLHTDVEIFHERFLDSLQGQELPLQLVPLSLVLVAEDVGGRIVGVLEVLPPSSAIVGMRDMGYPGVLAMMLAVTVGKVRGLAVDEAVRGQGWGSALLRRGMEVYDQLGFVTLHGSFDASSTRLEGFYRSHGFTVLGVGEKVEMKHLGPTLVTGSDPTERMFARHRDASALPWGDLLAGR
jgi:ribosomal protein S18 acetylase RimI-like enzyme